MNGFYHILNLLMVRLERNKIIFLKNHVGFSRQNDLNKFNAGVIKYNRMKALKYAIKEGIHVSSVLCALSPVNIVLAYDSCL